MGCGIAGRVDRLGRRARAGRVALGFRVCLDGPPDRARPSLVYGLSSGPNPCLWRAPELRKAAQEFSRKSLLLLNISQSRAVCVQLPSVLPHFLMEIAHRPLEFG